jgi:hypothetical protein
VPFHGLDVQTHNPLFGTTNHPLNNKLTPGGSSGGSAAAVINVKNRINCCFCLFEYIHHTYLLGCVWYGSCSFRCRLAWVWFLTLSNTQDYYHYIFILFRHSFLSVTLFSFLLLFSHHSIFVVTDNVITLDRYAYPRLFVGWCLSNRLLVEYQFRVVSPLHTHTHTHTHTQLSHTYTHCNNRS